MNKFGEHVQRMHADRDKWFETEYNVSLKQEGIHEFSPRPSHWFML